ncbi:hypothetical protein [Flammeovirga aprica]|uniref:Uncharacterized protein n=1 Tax=Flammeovirga aprica JL-4 TaxID=694437 RepID=A0A7X9XD61_9BACT|nr:hypothetical protein [Flammeovirga aprica]NME72551.1 hypothetical protein [Flammeovirga aprica JL-4]
MLFIVILISTFLLIVFFKKERWIKYGNLEDSFDYTINDHQYYIEEVSFKTYNEAHSKYFKVVDAISRYGTTINQKYDLYDWSFSTFQFKDTLIDVRYFRSTHSIRLIKSKQPLSIEEYEKDDLGYHMELNR